ncbi:MAG: 5-amino-6-(D-ribitylamino)uracil--L-tyrosine 4-hydroxyphenyl transferase CofH [Candidatus Hydrothermarchaeaceae archaeon]
MDTEVGAVLDKVLSSERLAEEDALLLMQVEGGALLFMGIVANKMRERAVGDTVTYIVNRNINFTNVCTGSCKFCAFRKGERDADAYFLDVEQVVEKAKEAKNAGATELCIQGGLHPDVDIDYYTDMLKALKNGADSNLHVHAFSPMEIAYVSQKSGLGIRETLRVLKESGLDSIPGTAAEILVDSVRDEICPEKIRADEWMEIIKEAHAQGISTTATMLYGHVESPEEQVKHLSILRDIQDKTGGFTEFIPLSFVHFNTPLFRSGNCRSGATGIEDLRLFALSRLFLDNFKNIQASWVKLGRKLSQVMLCFGANDLGGTLVEENISHSAGINSEMLTEEELVRMIVDAGRAPLRRDTLYSHQ